jgi:DNA-directed RNA polymerase subunit RPC12/RpoP
MEKSSTWTDLQETEYRCQMCAEKMEMMYRENIYRISCPLCGSSTVVKANSKEEAYEIAQRQGIIYPPID